MAKMRAKTMADDPAPMETELRLAGDPDVLKAIFASPCMALEADAKEKISDLDSRYFDTSDLDLRARGLAFRVRANGEGYRQTLKAGDDVKAAMLKRSEWETALDDARPRPEDLPKGAKAHLPKAAFEDGLRQAFVTRMQRRVRKVATEGAGCIEACLDLGEVVTEEGHLPIAEIELELIEGRPEALYNLALQLQDVGPLRLETRSKSTRAFDRLSGNPPGFHLAASPSLDPADSVDQAMTAIFESCFVQWLANQAAAIDGRDPEGVHQMRVALRRLRSAFSVFRKLIPADQLAWLQTGARQAIGALGPARDWDVFQAELLAPVMAARPDDPGLDALAKRVRTRSKTSYRRVRQHLESADYTRFALQVGQWLERRAWREGADDARKKALSRPIADFAGKLLSKRLKHALSKGEGFDDLPTAERHELRIAMKKLRYAVDFFRPLFDRKAVKPFVRRVKDLQDSLGHLNDVAVAETLLDQLQARPGKIDIRGAAGMVIGWHARGVAVIEPELRREWRAFRQAPIFWR